MAASLHSSMASLSVSSNSFLSHRFSPLPVKPLDRRKHCYGFQHTSCRIAVSSVIELASMDSTLSGHPSDAFDIMRSIQVELPEISIERFLIADIDPATAKLAISILGPFLSAFAFLFIVRIVMSWYPKLPVGKFPYVIAYAPTEPLLIVTRKLIPPLGGVDVTPVVWFGLVSFLNEILVGPQGLLVLLSQQVS